MRRHSAILTWAVVAAIGGSGCARFPLLDNPTRIADGPTPAVEENPVLVCPTHPNNAESYFEVFEKVIDVVDDFFLIDRTNRYDGRIICRPTIAPGYEQIWKPGSPDVRERLWASTQHVRHRCEVKIREAEPAGYFVEVKVLKELKDEPAPSAPATSPATFGDGTTVDRDQFIVVDPASTSPIADKGARWIPKGRDSALEQKIIRRLQRLQ